MGASDPREDSPDDSGEATPGDSAADSPSGDGTGWDEVEYVGGVPVRTKWFKLGVALAVLSALYTAFLVYLLQFDQSLALLVALVVSVVGGVAVTLFVLRY